MRLKKFVTMTLAAVLLTACSSSSSKTTKTNTTVGSVSSFSGDYYKMINTGRGGNSEQVYLEFSSSQDFVTIGSGLQALSQSHFSTSDYYLAEGTDFTFNEYKALMKRDSAGATKKKYDKWTLQPVRGTSVGGVKNPIMVTNLTEQAYYVKSGTGYELKGASFAIILNPKKEDSTDLDSPMSSSAIKEYSQKVMSRFYKYIRANKKDLKNIPILMAVYMKNDSSVSLSNGNYVWQAFCENGEVGSIKSVNHENVTFTSTRAKKIDPTTSSEFETLKGSLKSASTEAAGLVGEAVYMNNTIQTMKMTAHLNIKSYTEMLYLTSVLADRIDDKFTQDFQIKCLVYSQDELMAVIIKNKGEDAKTTIIEQ